MFNRRTIIAAGASALTATIAPIKAIARPRTTRVKIDLSTINADHWAREIPWQRASHPDAHITTIRSHSTVVLQSKIMLAPLDQFNFQRDLFHGDGSLYLNDGMQMHGFSSYYGTRDETQAQCARNVIDGGNRGDNLTSIWLVGWGFSSIFMACDEVSPTIKQLPRRGGLVINDWRYVVRVANLSFYLPPEHTATLMQRALIHLPTIKNTVFYAAPDLLKNIPGEGKHGIVIGGKSWPVRSVEALNRWEDLVGPVPV